MKITQGQYLSPNTNDNTLVVSEPFADMSVIYIYSYSAIFLQYRFSCFLPLSPIHSSRSNSTSTCSQERAHRSPSFFSVSVTLTEPYQQANESYTFISCLIISNHDLILVLIFRFSGLPPELLCLFFLRKVISFLVNSLLPQGLSAAP